MDPILPLEIPEKSEGETTPEVTLRSLEDLTLSLLDFWVRITSNRY